MGQILLTVLLILSLSPSVVCARDIPRGQTRSDTLVSVAGNKRGPQMEMTLCTGGVVDVRSYGAVGDGVTDDAPAIQAAIDAALAETCVSRGASGGYLGSAPTVYFPYGVYAVCSTLAGYSYTRFAGSDALLVCRHDTQSILSFACGCYDVSIHGIAFRGGRNAIYIDTGNVNSGTIYISECKFQDCRDWAIETSPDSASSNLVIEKCKFRDLSRCLKNYCMASFRECWVSAEAETDTAAFENHGVLYLHAMLGVPAGYAAMNTNERWIDNHHALYCTNCRFGGEGGGRPVVWNFADSLSAVAYPYVHGSVVSLRNCAAIGSSMVGDPNSAGVVILKAGLPNQLIVEDCSYGGFTSCINTRSIADGTTLDDYLVTIPTSRPTRLPTFFIRLKGNAFNYSQGDPNYIVTPALDGSSDFERLVPWMEVSSPRPGVADGNWHRFNEVFVSERLGVGANAAHGARTTTIEAGVHIADDDALPPLNITMRTCAPSEPTTHAIYLDDGANTLSGSPGLRWYTGQTWEDIGETVYHVINIRADTRCFEPRGLHLINSSKAAISGALPDGTTLGQRVKFVCKAGGNSIDIEVSHHATSDPETIRLDAAKEWVELVWDGVDWVETGGLGQTYP